MSYCNYCGATVDHETNRCGNCQIADLIEPRKISKEEKKRESRKGAIGFIAFMSIVTPLWYTEEIISSLQTKIIMWIVCLAIFSVCIWLNTRPDKK